MDGRGFPTEPWMASRKIPMNIQVRACALAGKAFFFGSFLLTLIKRNEPAKGGSFALGLDLSDNRI